MTSKKICDHCFMSIALSLAKNGSPSPNPYVGAVIVKNGKIIGKGFHEKSGSPHAEINAINSVKNKKEIKNSTLYTTLEPCSHFGKTPPCTDAILKSGIKRVVFASRDPTKKVCGEEILKKSGIKITSGILEKKSKKLNEVFYYFSEKKSPFIALKAASSKNSKIGIYGKKTKITGRKAVFFSHILRSKYDSILVGINTILSDDPLLTTRIKNKKSPIKIILDSKLIIPLSANVLKDKNTIIATTSSASRNKKNILQKSGIRVVVSGRKKINLKKLLGILAKSTITSILVEGGTKVHTSFLKSKSVNKIYLFKSKTILNGETIPLFEKKYLSDFMLKEKRPLGKDSLNIFERKNKKIAPTII
ncbi:MAG: bifunctional diaminohydroxyphosphoribosylaminopyrimidine deaminase/5-amino-6-(5-phosphoribosylamino)uracil reductase RibD [Candidatus Micrarchaeia archaeon]